MVGGISDCLPSCSHNDCPCRGIFAHSWCVDGSHCESSHFTFVIYPKMKSSLDSHRVTVEPFNKPSATDPVFRIGLIQPLLYNTSFFHSVMSLHELFKILSNDDQCGHQPISKHLQLLLAVHNSFRKVQTYDTVIPKATLLQDQTSTVWSDFTDGCSLATNSAHFVC